MTNLSYEEELAAVLRLSADQAANPCHREECGEPASNYTCACGAKYGQRCWSKFAKTKCKNTVLGCPNPVCSEDVPVDIFSAYLPPDDKEVLVERWMKGKDLADMRKLVIDGVFEAGECHVISHIPVPGTGKVVSIAGEAWVMQHARDHDQTHVVNVAAQVKDALLGATYLPGVKIMDEDPNAVLEAGKCYMFIDQALEEGGNVLVHCIEGKSRSGAIVVGYIMYRTGWTFDQALAYCRQYRQTIDPYKNFIQYLALGG